MNRCARPRHVLHVEDDPGDAHLVRIAWSELDCDATLHVVRDGIEALAFLRREPPFTTAPRPDLVLLDLNLPRMDGREVLEVVKGDADLRQIPVCVLTTSRADSDVARSYALSANAYIPKPLSIADFVEVVRNIDRFWFRSTILPEH